MAIRKLCVGLLICLILFGHSTSSIILADPLAPVEPMGYPEETARAYQIEIAFWDPVCEPHWGAFFRSSYLQCWSPHYLGEGGDAATAPYSGGIANWDWWGSPPVVLLLPKSWLNWPACIPTLSCKGPKWTASNYEATCALH